MRGFLCLYSPSGSLVRSALVSLQLSITERERRVSVMSCVPKNDHWSVFSYVKHSAEMHPGYVLQSSSAHITSLHRDQILL
jgi:hypothetical protein